MRRQGQITLVFEYPPIPIRTHDWYAYWDPEEQLEGHGATALEALTNLVEATEDWEDQQEDVCIAGNPAVNGHCYNTDCVCGGPK